MGHAMGTASVGGPTKFCVACGQTVDARAEICPACGVRQPWVAGVDNSATEQPRTTGTVSLAAGLLALLSAAIGSVGYIWAYSTLSTDMPSRTYAYAAALALPVAVVSLAYLGRSMSGRLAGGVLIGFGMLELVELIASSLPLDGSSFDPNVITWVLLASSVVAIVAGLLAAATARTGSMT
ncbi:MAG TPA: zinc ribbon domain-containing protein [Actinomycetes bacterium]|nr:zinc ribbon domain-containing protein [Actinomycetes bacterium]